MSKHATLSVTLGLVTLLTGTGCATVFSALLGAALCQGNSSCLGDAVTTGVSADVAIAGAMIESASQRGQARRTAEREHLCGASDGSGRGGYYPAATPGDAATR